MSQLPNLDFIYDELDRLDIEVRPAKFQKRTALIRPDGLLAVDYRRVENQTQELELLMEEIGHYETGAYYTLNSPFALRQQQENRAQRHIYEHYYPPTLIAQYMAQGITTPWALADALGLSEPFVSEMLAYYTTTCGINFNTLAAQAEEAPPHQTAGEASPQNPPPKTAAPAQPPAAPPPPPKAPPSHPQPFDTYALTPPELPPQTQWLTDLLSTFFTRLAHPPVLPHEQ